MINSSSYFVYCLFLIISIVDLYINYNEKYFPEYHEKRVKFNVCGLLANIMTIFLIIASRCGPGCVCLVIIIFLIIIFAGVYYAISSFYLYFAYDGSTKIKKPIIRIFLWISFLSFIINLCSSCFNSRSSSTNLNNENSDNIELKEEKV